MAETERSPSPVTDGDCPRFNDRKEKRGAASETAIFTTAR